MYFAVEQSLQFADGVMGKVRTLATLDKPLEDVGIRVSPEEQYVVWTQLDRDTPHLMLVQGHG